MEQALHNAFTIGCDVEFFAAREGNFVSAIPHIGDEVNGTKHNPIVFPDGSTLQRDNVAAEFATAVAGTGTKFRKCMFVAIHHMIETLGRAGLKAAAVASVVFPDEELDHWEAHEFGCDPDFNAWSNGGVNPKPCAVNSNLRTAALHVHVGHKGLKAKGKKLRMIRLMDAVHGVVSTFLDTAPESLRRKELYGKAGAFRPTSYGVEYRVLSNYFAASPRLVQLIYNLTADSMRILLKDEDEKLIKMLGQKDIIDVVNTGDSSAGHSMFRKYISRFISANTTEMVLQLRGYAPKSLKEEWNG